MRKLVGCIQKYYYTERYINVSDINIYIFAINIRGMFTVQIESTSGKYDKKMKELGESRIKQFEHLEDAIWYCWKMSDNDVIVSKSFDKKSDFDLEIYDSYRE